MATRRWHAEVGAAAAIVTLAVLAMGASWLATLQSTPKPWPPRRKQHSRRIYQEPGR